MGNLLPMLILCLQYQTQEMLMRYLQRVCVVGMVVLGWGAGEVGWAAAKVPGISVRLGSAHVESDGDTLVASTGAMERRWWWTDAGFVTTALEELGTGRRWVTKPSSLRCDWSFPGLIADDARAELISLTAERSDDAGFTTPHLRLCAEIRYAQTHVVVRHIVWVYPDAPGLRTQVQVKAEEGYVAPKTRSGRAEFLPVPTAGLKKRAVGYFNDTQHRNRAETEILREEPVTDGTVDWASILSLEGAEGGVLLVKESHKCVNQKGVDTGAFEISKAGVASTGWGLSPEDITEDRFRGVWAHWVVVYSGGEAERLLALKQFDRIRYPIDPERDMYILANTWGSTAVKRNAQIQAREDNVLAEIESQADLGIDVQQIDDGWQGFDYDSWRPVPSNALRPADAAYSIYESDMYPVYPEGWKNVRAAARRRGVKLGLWAAWGISTDELIRNQREGDFRYFKVDFARLNTLDKIEALTGKARALIEASGHTVRINWDVTENAPRVGYFFGREYGNIYLENRKPIRPEQVVYVPYLVLRDAWQVARYLNLNKFQVTVQNADRVNRNVSDAWKHSHAYCVAQTLMSAPIFFQETHYYTNAARAEIRSLLTLYKRHRAELFRGYVFPLGEKPDNRSWSGFQNHNPETGAGYLLIFRQIENTEPVKDLRLHFLAGRAVTLTELRSGRPHTLRPDSNGTASFEIEKAGHFLYYRYKMQ